MTKEHQSFHFIWSCPMYRLGQANKAFCYELKSLGLDKRTTLVYE